MKILHNALDMDNELPSSGRRLNTRSEEDDEYWELEDTLDMTTVKGYDEFLRQPGEDQDTRYEGSFNP